MLSQPERQPIAVDQCAPLLGDAQAALRAARYDEALQLTTHCDEWPAPLNEQAALVRIDILTRRDPVEALEELARVSDFFTSKTGRFGYCIASAKAYAHARNFDAAASMLRDASEIAPELDKPAIAQLAYQQARLKWMLQDYDPACGEIAIALREENPDMQVSALLLRSWMHAGREAYTSQIADLRSAIGTALASPGQCDAAMVSSAIASLLGVAFDQADADAMREGEQAFDALTWTSDIQVNRFQSLRILAWDAFLHGHSARAQWLFKDSKDVAPSIAWKVIAHLDRAYIARMNLNEIWANEELLEAHRLARTVVWADTRGEERQALMTLAILFAPFDMAQAQRYVSTYTGLGAANINPTLGMSHDRRMLAAEKYASGRVHQMLGNKELAQKEFEAAYEVHAGNKNHYRAALCAWGLAEVTGGGTWLKKARDHAGHFPKSPLYERLQDDIDSGEQSDPFAGLTPVEREMAIALCHGSEHSELSKRFSRSPVTLQKQVASIYHTFGVSNRNELRAELQRRGVFG